ncbi:MULTISPECIES: hypothetical protein [Pseudomonas syringae group]|nr:MULTISPECIES: hypothetical protein [Pseudomonas syringae group]MDH4602411.1 hypothetical protein [Pseudomonas syringae pv. papulans]
MTKKNAVREAMEYNRCAIIARRLGDLPSSVAGFCERRDFLMRMARQA